MTPDGAGEPPDRESRPRVPPASSSGASPLDHLEAASHPFRGASRSLRRIRFLRGAFITIAIVLLAVVVREIWSNRPRRKSAAAPPPVASRPDNATQTLDKFEYTATELGQLAYRILADKLTGVEGGLHTLQGIRRAEFRLADGRTLTASADRGTFTTNESEGRGAAGGTGGKGAGGTGGNDAGGAPGASGGADGGADGGKTDDAGSDTPPRRGHGLIVLEGHVVVTSDVGERLESDRIEYYQAESRLVSPGTCRFRLVPPASAQGDLGPSEGEAGRVTYDLGTKIIGMQDGVVIRMTNEGAPETIVTSSQARFAADGTSADLEGSARVERGEEFLAAPRIHLTRTDDGGVTHMVAETGATGRIHPASRPGRGEGGGARPTLVAARTIDATDSAATGERRVSLEGDASLEEEAMPGGPPGRTLSARTIVLREAARAPGAKPDARGPRTLHAEQNVRATFPPAPGESDPRVLTCRTLDAVSAPDGSLATADADGSFALNWGPRRAFSTRAHVVGETHIELRGARPVVEEPDRRIVADEIDYDTRPAQLAARGSVQTRFVPQSERGETRAGRTPAVATTAAADGSTSSALPFKPGVPVDVLSDTAVMKQDAKSAEFSGHVRARQGDRALSAAHLVVNDTDKTARADGSVTVRSFREQSSGAAAAVKVPVQIDADTLLHDDAKKITRFSGNTVYREPGRVLRADSVTLEGGSGGAPATTRAEGHVAYEGEGKRGTGDLAVHHEDAKSVTLEGRERPAQVTEIASGRTWRGPSLTWVQATDSIPVVTGTSGRSRIVGSISSQQRDSVGKPTDRGKPR